MKTQIKNFGKVGCAFSDVRNDTCPDIEKKNDTLREREIEDVVIVGYKTQKKSSLTAAVSIISDKN